MPLNVAFYLGHHFLLSSSLLVSRKKRDTSDSFLLSVSKKLTCIKVNKGAKIRKRYNQVPHLTQDTNGKVTNSQLDSTNKSQEVRPFPSR